jgi:hypothetical protein
LAAGKRTVGGNMRRFLLIALSGLLLGVVVGATAVPVASSAARSTGAAGSNPPCTSADYVVTVSVTNQSTTIWSLSVSGQIDFATDAATANLTLPTSFPVSFLAGTTLQAVLVGGTVYVTVPPALAGFVGGASWVSIALPSSLTTAVDDLLSHLATLCGNPQSVVSTLSSRRHAPTSLGTSLINGAPVTGTHLSALDRKATKALGLTRTLMRGSSRFGGSSVPVNVWINGQRRLAQLETTLPNSTASYGPFDVSVTIDFTNVDQPVPITAPAGAVPLPSSVVGFLGGLPGGPSHL